MYEEAQKDIIIRELKELLNIQVSLTNRKMVEMLSKPAMNTIKSRWHRVTKKIARASKVENKARSPTAQTFKLSINPSNILDFFNVFEYIKITNCYYVYFIVDSNLFNKIVLCWSSNLFEHH